MTSCVLRYSTSDAMYQPSGVDLCRIGARLGRYIGQQPAIKGAWAITDRLHIAIQTAVFVPGTAAKNYATKADEYYLALTLNYRF